jgi:DNA polymerase elongation subunit (family B)
MPKLIFDIETVGEDFDSLDKTTQKVLTNWIDRSSDSPEEYERELANIKNGLGFSPYTGQIVAIGTLDADKGQGGVYYDAPGQKNADAEEDGIMLRQMGEKELLQKFWDVAKNYDTFISFNGRSFDAPFIYVRSAIHRIKPTRNLMEGRYDYQQKSCKHIDLMDKFIFDGAVYKRPSLHIICRAFGIKSPKADGITGDDVARLFKEKKFLDIARYNVGDLRATKALYDYWDKYIRF